MTDTSAFLPVSCEFWGFEPGTQTISNMKIIIDRQINCNEFMMIVITDDGGIAIREDLEAHEVSSEFDDVYNNSLEYPESRSGMERTREALKMLDQL